MIPISVAMTFVVLIVTILSSISDIRDLRIPNWHSLVIIAAFFIAYAFSPKYFHSLNQHLIAMGIMFAVTYLMFACKVIGGGDAKLGTALGLWAGLKSLIPFIFYMTLIGGVLGVMALLLRKRKVIKKPRRGSWIDQAQKGYSAVPYGVAISLGFWIALSHTEPMRAQLHSLLTTFHIS